MNVENISPSTCVNCSQFTSESEYITDSTHISARVRFSRTAPEPSWESPGLKESSFGRSAGGIWTPAKVNISQSGAAAGQSYLMQLCLIRKVLQHLTQIFYSARSRRIFFQAEWSSWKRSVELLRFHEWKAWLIFHIKRVAAKITVTRRSIKALEMKDNDSTWTERVCRTRACLIWAFIGECHENMPWAYSYSPQK